MLKYFKKEAVNICDLIQMIVSTRKKGQTFIVGIDGLGGSGKSILAEKISMSDSNVMVIHLDDFYLPSYLRLPSEKTKHLPGANFDLKRLRTQVLEPLLKNKDSKYQRYDWVSDTLAETHVVRYGSTVIVEGVYALLPVLIDMYNLTVWVECPREIRLARGITRDGSDQLNRWLQEWIPPEDFYTETYKPMLKADVMINGASESFS